ncbi:homoserine dehydrogenase [Streptomyces spectabilis]|uniref:Homoserine dehydrogenase n=1 Tax=Streptomyces spectabilis TaxID=68270 RepID=A0A516RH60_STRST|nr:homoserine dehydrogenase [Streptomyces spectabilis]QDQ14992.1 homoserine dehydrogenase [Streptomyces spectabilis]
MRSRPLKVAVLGCGVVGTEVVRRLHEAPGALADRIGAPVELAGVAVRDLTRPRDLGIDPALFRNDPLELVKRDGVDVVVELLGGIEPARSLLVTAMEHGASVVSANKALVAEYGAALHETAARHGVDLLYEASVAAAVPLLRPLRDSLGGDDIRRVCGIVNGTTNYILDRMTQTGGEFDAALREAVERGYVEADPTADVEGTDAAAKAVILTSLALHTWLTPSDVHREGITRVTAEDVADAHSHGCVVKLIATLERTADDGEVQVRVHPAMVPLTHPLADVRGADNAVVIEAAGAGRLLFRGAGAGGVPTASAVVGDLVTAARARLLARRTTATPDAATPPAATVRARPMRELRGRYHLSVRVADPTAALDDIVSALRAHDVPVDSVRRRRTAEHDTWLLVTETTREADLLAAVESLAALPAVASAPRFLRILDPLGQEAVVG